MSSRVIAARARVKSAREKHAVAKHTFQQTDALKSEIIESFLALGFSLETAEQLYKGCYQAADVALAEALNELEAANEDLDQVDPRPTIPTA
ncbi:hypothetical protein I5S84_09860 [Pseudomonas putida]|uniref:Uncharacterized protein n=1 Tax=Pseudomonas putida TaxID=303 RepID=A0A6I6XRU8_PSEPU|nr:hypothetical protein [Pseudomonas putida]MBH3449152.1 hypothetical protein [Pseudomonas putida]QHG66780.2 hypothetical protein C2H86_21200 [Pseudomonas putida]